jgi:hypothetical protein
VFPGQFLDVPVDDVLDAARAGDAAARTVIVVGSVVHAILIVGTMESISKAALCGLVIAATTKVIADLRLWSKRSAAR